MFGHRRPAMDPETVKLYLCVTIAGFTVLDSAIRQWVLNASVGFLQIIHTSYAEIFYANIR